MACEGQRQDPAAPQLAGWVQEGRGCCWQDVLPGAPQFSPKESTTYPHTPRRTHPCALPTPERMMYYSPASFMSAEMTTRSSCATSSAPLSHVSSAARSHRISCSSTAPLTCAGTKPRGTSSRGGKCAWGLGSGLSLDARLCMHGHASGVRLGRGCYSF